VGGIGGGTKPQQNKPPQNNAGLLKPFVSFLRETDEGDAEMLAQQKRRDEYNHVLEDPYQNGPWQQYRRSVTPVQRYHYQGEVAGPKECLAINPVAAVYTGRYPPRVGSPICGDASFPLPCGWIGRYNSGYKVCCSSKAGKKDVVTSDWVNIWTK